MKLLGKYQGHINSIVDAGGKPGIHGSNPIFNYKSLGANYKSLGASLGFPAGTQSRSQRLWTAEGCVMQPLSTGMGPL